MLLKNIEISTLVPKVVNSSLLLVFGFPELDSRISLFIFLALFIQILVGYFLLLSI